MNNTPFQFKHFALSHHQSALKIGTDSVLLASVIPAHDYHNILDIGTGCGVILFCLAQRFVPETDQVQYLTGIDIDCNSIKEAEENKQRFPVFKNQNIDFKKVSLQEHQMEKRKYDLIVSNPPFFGNALKSPFSEKNLSKHRDHNLSFEDLANGVCTLLSENGVFYLILPTQEMAQFDTITTQKGLSPCFQMDVYPIQGKPMHRIIKGYCKYIPSDYKVEKLCIREPSLGYSDEYKEVTKPFYIKY